MTYGVPPGAGRPAPGAGWGAPLPAGFPVDAAGTRLRLVPGRIARFLLVLGLVAAMLVPRLTTEAAAVSDQPQVHVVSRGETLWGVAQRNAADQDPRDYVDRLLRVNRLASPQIVPGQTLLLP